MREHLGISAKRVFPVVYKQTSVKLIPKSILALGRMIPKVERAPRIPTKWVFLVVDKQTINVVLIMNLCISLNMLF